MVRNVGKRYSFCCLCCSSADPNGDSLPHSLQVTYLLVSENGPPQTSSTHASSRLSAIHPDDGLEPQSEVSLLSTLPVEPGPVSSPMGPVVLQRESSSGIQSDGNLSLQRSSSSGIHGGPRAMSPLVAGLLARRRGHVFGRPKAALETVRELSPFETLKAETVLFPTSLRFRSSFIENAFMQDRLTSSLPKMAAALRYSVLTLVVVGVRFEPF